MPVKGIDILLNAYSRYRSMVQDPWELAICGVGPLTMSEIEGVRWLGFAEPHKLAKLLAEAGAFVLASTFEPWGVVLHEAAAASRPIIATDACGAVGTFVLNDVNGRVVPAQDAEALAIAMTEISIASDERRLEWGTRSSDLAQRSSPELWVDILSGLHSDWRARSRAAYNVDSTHVRAGRKNVSH
ncbi:MAG: glycosyltransferase family 4 protein [Kineosporiaceae bacterium]|nr:glycosyltransferase family 4 protein [Kineosporiaceae bacterium]